MGGTASLLSFAVRRTRRLPTVAPVAPPNSSIHDSDPPQRCLTPCARLRWHAILCVVCARTRVWPRLRIRLHWRRLYRPSYPIPTDTCEGFKTKAKKKGQSRWLPKGSRPARRAPSAISQFNLTIGDALRPGQRWLNSARGTRSPSNLSRIGPPCLLSSVRPSLVHGVALLCSLPHCLVILSRRLCSCTRPAARVPRRAKHGTTRRRLKGKGRSRLTVSLILVAPNA